MKASRLLFLFVASLLCASATLADEWISLFDGKSLDGWRANERPESWAVEDGAIVTRGDRSHLFYDGAVADADFKNFEFSAQVKTEPGSNSGIYVYTAFQPVGWPFAGYECQVINSNPPVSDPDAYVERKMTGSIYAVRNVWVSPVGDGEWFEYRILVSGKTIQTFINGELICEYTEPSDPWRPLDKIGRRLGSGTIAFQAHDPDSVTHFRDIRVRLLPDEAPTLGEPLADAELDRLITRFSNDNLPLIDIGLAARSSANKAALRQQARRYGLSLAEDFGLRSSRIKDAGVQVIVDNGKTDLPEALAKAKEAGKKVVFSSGGQERIDEVRFKARLQAIESSGLGWKDFWLPGQKG